MSTMKSLILALSVLFVGCAAEASDDASLEGDLGTGDSMPAAFKLYDAPNAEASAECDVHTALQLTAKSASLREVVTGKCRLAVEPDARAYALVLVDEPCGSKVYKGSARVGDQTRAITVTDHRTRVCRDLMPAQIVVEESDAARGSVTRFSN